MSYAGVTEGARHGAALSSSTHSSRINFARRRDKRTIPSSSSVDGFVLLIDLPLSSLLPPHHHPPPLRPKPRQMDPLVRGLVSEMNNFDYVDGDSEPFNTLLLLDPVYIYTIRFVLK